MFHKLVYGYLRWVIQSVVEPIEIHIQSMLFNTPTFHIDVRNDPYRNKQCLLVWGMDAFLLSRDATSACKAGLKIILLFGAENARKTDYSIFLIGEDTLKKYNYSRKQDAYFETAETFSFLALVQHPLES